MRLSGARVRNLGVEELGVEPHPSVASAVETGTEQEGGVTSEPVGLPEDHELVKVVRELLARYGGVILSGPPGTSKTYYAARLAVTLAGSPTRVRFVQFHPSYQYEDFVQGFVPQPGGGFTLTAKHLMEMAQAAAEEPRLTFVMVIDELSRGDPARVFGEGLTYVEKTKRGLTFSLASGDEFAIPENLLFLATMNPLDRGVDEVDAAFERRFAKVAMDPSVAILEEFLDNAGLSDPIRGRVVGFFRFVNRQAQDNPQTALGHTFFLGIDGPEALRSLWDHQLRFFFEKAYQLDAHGHREIVAHWERMFAQRGERGAEGEPGATSAPMNATAAENAEQSPGDLAAEIEGS